MIEASKKREEKGNGRSVRHTNPRRSSDCHGEADANTILLLDQHNASRARSLHSSQRKHPPHALDRSLSLAVPYSLPCSLNRKTLRLVPINENNAFRLIFLNMAPKTSSQYIYSPMITRLYTPGAWRFPSPMITRLYTPGAWRFPERTAV